MSDCVPQIVQENGRSVLRPCPEEPPEEAEEPTTGAEIHETIIGGGLVNGDPEVAAQLQHTQLGASYTSPDDRFAIGVDFVGPVLDTRVDGLDGQDPVTIRQAFFRYHIPNFSITIGGSDTRFGYRLNNPAAAPTITADPIYNAGYVNDLGVGITVGEEPVQFLMGINGSNYSAYPFINDYPAGYVGVAFATGILGMNFNVGLGPETEDSDDMHVLGEAIVNIDPSDAVHLGAIYNEHYDINAGNEAHYRGASVYFDLTEPNEIFTWANRFGFWQDEMGFVSGNPNELYLHVSTAADLRFGPGFLAGVQFEQQIGLNDETPDGSTVLARLGFDGIHHLSNND